MNISPDNITKLNDNEIFVFGSNEAGIHGAGAAKLAREKFGAIGGEGFGLQGKSYAIPTKDYDIITLNRDKIAFYVKAFLVEAYKHSELNFLVTEIGCGLAGYKPEDIAPLFKSAPENVFLPKRFVDILSM